MMRTAALVATLSLLVGCTGDCTSLDGGVSIRSRLAGASPTQISIEVRFVSVTDNFLETVGVNFQRLDTFSSGASGGGNSVHGSTVVVPTFLVGGQSNRDVVFFPNQHASRLVPVLNNSAAAFATAPEGCFFFDPNALGLSNQVLNNFDLSFPNGITTATPAGLQFGIGFLDDFELSALIQAAQQDQNNRVLSAPQVTLFNDQTAVISSMHVVVNVEDLQPHVRNDITRTQSDVEFAQTGFTLQLMPQIIPGTNDIRVTLLPGAQLATIDLPSGDDNQQQTIKLPLLFESRVATQVNIPNGMTLILGEQGFMGSNMRTGGVPIFGEIPLLKSFFEREGNTEDDRTLLVFVTPQIIQTQE